jgi:hypothetical protein
MSKPSEPSAATDEALRAMLKSQYHAALAILKETIERCPEELWLSDRYHNAFWQVAYHALFFAHLYMMPRLEDFRPWAEHQGDVQHEDGIPGPVDPNSKLPVIPEPYSRQQALAYWAICDGMVDHAVDALDLHSSQSGFHWYPIPKLEHQLVNLRHIQHHMAQLADRLRTEEEVGIRWVGARRA